MTHGRIVIDSERCKGCELCTSVCPQHVLAMAGVFNSSGYLPAQLLDPAGACTGCGVCAVICPDTAITVYRQATQEPRMKNREPLGSISGSRFSILGPAERRLS
jgi:2-oxoglutarate ferredoxin oxidoreductase subunit delta